MYSSEKNLQNVLLKSKKSFKEKVKAPEVL
jgi:hypothetical protein